MIDFLIIIFHVALIFKSVDYLMMPLFIYCDRSAGALGPHHTHHVPAGLLAHLAQGPEVLHLCWRALFSSGCRCLHYLSKSGHHNEAM